MDFRTELTVKESHYKINLSDSIVTLGSCFSDEIGQKLIDNKFMVSKNPFGTVYNPISIHKLLVSSILKEAPSADGFIEQGGVFYHFDFHSDWVAKSRKDLDGILRNKMNEVNRTITNCQFLIITYGTSWVYEERELKAVVANCHKGPQSKFEKSLLTQKRIVESFDEIHRELKKLNKDLRLILTVSPVRHIKDTLELNSVSKSILRLACHTLSETFADVTYFPSYEIMLDDLRDYRFYKPDLIHPSEVAIDYIWQKFGAVYFSTDTKIFLTDWAKIKSALNHKPFQPGSEAHQQFLRDTLAKLHQVRKTVDVQEEIELLESQLL